MKIEFILELFWKRKDVLMYVMRTFIFLFCTTLFSFMPNDILSQNDKIVIDVDMEVSVDEVFKIVKKQTDYIFTYHSDLFLEIPKVRLKKGVVQLDKLLQHCIPYKEFKVIFSKDNTILIKGRDRNSSTLQYQLSGVVTDGSGLPIPGVTVLIKGTNKGTATDIDGKYGVTVPDPASVLVFSALGFETQEIVAGSKTILNVSLVENVTALSGVTLNAGYYNTSQRETTGSISNIKAKTIEQQPVNSPLGAMVGQMAGVNITQTSGIPGGGFNIEIRGQNFLNGNTNPLYIVDGVPISSEIIGQELALGIISRPTTTLSPINSINPADIESIEVLKDADATAIYGSRGANGVVLITTKRGRAGKTRVDVNVSSSFGKAIFLDLMNTQQYLEMRLEAFANDGREPRETDYDVNGTWDLNRDTDWQETLLGKTAFRQNVQLSVSGGNEQTQFLLGGGYQNETTVFPGDSNYKRGSLNSHFNHKSTNNRLQLNFSTNYAVEDNRLPDGDLAFFAYQLAPNAPALFDENGDLNWENNTWTNPLASLENEYRAQTRTLIMNMVMSYRLFAGVEFRTNLGYNSYNTEQYRTNITTSRPPHPFNTSEQSSVLTTNASRQSWIAEPQIEWKRNWGKSSLKVLLGTTFQQQRSKQIDLFGVDFPSDTQILNLNAADDVAILSDQESEYNYQAVFGRINFNWADKYIINLTGRRDGSSRFGPGRQFGNFGALGVAWLFSEEVFLEENPIISFGKLRSSYGVTGSDNIPNYGFYDTFESFDGDYDGSVLETSGLFNPDFGWEENKKFEAALELGFFKGRVFSTVAWYRNRSSNQLIGTPLAGTTGFNSVNANFDATVENSGFEVDFRSTNVQNNHFSWTTRANITIPKNRLVEFDGLESSTFRYRYEIGEPLTIIKLFNNLGVDQQTGVYTFQDYDNNGRIDIDDRQWIEDSAPRFFGGFGNTISYKNWTLDMLFNFKQQISTGDLSIVTNQPGFFRNSHVSALNRWQDVGDEAQFQQYTVFNNEVLTAHLNDRNSNRRYVNTSFVRLKNISLTYQIPKDVISGFDTSVYLQGQNLFYLYRASREVSSDPEQTVLGSSMSTLRQLTIGLTMAF